MAGAGVECFSLVPQKELGRKHHRSPGQEPLNQVPVIVFAVKVRGKLRRAATAVLGNDQRGFCRAGNAVGHHQQAIEGNAA